jgi:histidine triad (HIT) family protein
MTTIFGKIIRGELPADKVFENERIVAFKDIAPAAPVHILIVPKKEGLRNLDDLTPADYPLVGEMLSVAAKLAEEFSIEEGYRVVVNNGSQAGQTVFHLHFHLLGGKPLSKLC